MHISLPHAPRWMGLVSTTLVLTALNVCFTAQGASAEPRPDVPPMSVDGSTGLVRIPTAEVTPYGHFTLGISKVDRRYRPYPAEDERGDSIGHYVTVGVLPRVEVTARFTNHDGKLGAQFRPDLKGGLGGWNFDRMFSIQALLVRQSRRFPLSIAIGSQDAVGSGVFAARYLVVSHRGRSVGLHLGFGQRRLGKLFGGADFQPVRGVRLMLDHDGKDTNLGLGLTYRDFTITPILTGVQALGAGFTYTRPI